MLGRATAFVTMATITLDVIGMVETAVAVATITTFVQIAHASIALLSRKVEMTVSMSFKDRVALLLTLATDSATMITTMRDVIGTKVTVAAIQARTSNITSARPALAWTVHMLLQVTTAWTLFRVLARSLRGREMDIVTTTTTMLVAIGTEETVANWTQITNIAATVNAWTAHMLLPATIAWTPFRVLARNPRGREMDIVTTTTITPAVTGTAETAVAGTCSIAMIVSAWIALLSAANLAPNRRGQATGIATTTITSVDVTGTAVTVVVRAMTTIIARSVRVWIQNPHVLEP